MPQHNIPFGNCKISIFFCKLFAAGAARGIRSTRCSAHVKAAKGPHTLWAKEERRKCKRKWLVHFLATHAASLWKGAVPSRCQSLLSSAMPEISGITIQVGCHSPTGRGPARTHPSPSKDLFLHPLHFKVRAKLPAK